MSIIFHCGPTPALALESTDSVLYRVTLPAGVLTAAVLLYLWHHLRWYTNNGTHQRRRSGGGDGAPGAVGEGRVDSQGGHLLLGGRRSSLVTEKRPFCVLRRVCFVCLGELGELGPGY